MAPNGSQSSGTESSRRAISGAKIVEPTQQLPISRTANATNSAWTAAPAATVDGAGYCLTCPHVPDAVRERRWPAEAPR